MAARRLDQYPLLHSLGSGKGKPISSDCHVPPLFVLARGIRRHGIKVTSKSCPAGNLNADTAGDQIAGLGLNVSCKPTMAIANMSKRLKDHYF